MPPTVTPDEKRMNRVNGHQAFVRPLFCATLIAAGSALPLPWSTASSSAAAANPSARETGDPEKCEGKSGKKDVKAKKDKSKDTKKKTKKEKKTKPATISLTGTIRDFLPVSMAGGHPDFGPIPAGGKGVYIGNIADDLDDDAKPVFVGGGQKIKKEWKDSSGRPILPALYDSERGDTAGSLVSGIDTGAITSSLTFGQWYRDTAGVNQSMPFTITLSRTGGTDDLPIYTYKTSKFFPIDGKLLGSDATGAGEEDGDDHDKGKGNDKNKSKSHNCYFTFEVHTAFTYDEGAGQVFDFMGDDDVWVFINKQLVADLGGVHSKSRQTVELDRLNLTDGLTYPLDFYFAQRSDKGSAFEMETSIVLESRSTPAPSPDEAPLIVFWEEVEN